MQVMRPLRAGDREDDRSFLQAIDDRAVDAL